MPTTCQTLCREQELFPVRKAEASVKNGGFGLQFRTNEDILYTYTHIHTHVCIPTPLGYLGSTGKKIFTVTCAHKPKAFCVG